MAGYIPILKAVLPYLAPLIQATMPIFTKISGKDHPSQGLQDTQISELQSEVQKNAESLQTLAEQLRQSIAAFDERELNDQINFSELKAATENISVLRGALEKSIRDIQTTKYLAIFAIAASFIALGYQLLKI